MLSGSLEADSSPPPIQTPRLRTLGVGGRQAEGIIPLFCHTSVQSIYIQDAGFPRPAMGTAHTMLSQGFETLRYLEIRTGPEYSEWRTEWDDDAIRARAVPLHKEMERRGGKFNLVL